MNKKCVYEKIVITADYDHKNFIKQVDLEYLVGSFIRTTTSRTDPNYTFEFTKEMLEGGVWSIENVGYYDDEFRLCFSFNRVPSEKELKEIERVRKERENLEKLQYEQLKKKFG